MKGFSSKESASQTKTSETSVSIIERIINSLTAISTTQKPDVTRTISPKTESSTRQSSILKLTTKKSAKVAKTLTTQKALTTVTTENPTTIIEKILSSLSAIQADNKTATKSIYAKQVGSNFNTISSPSTTPLTRVTKSALSAHSSTTLNPLFLLENIQNETNLQKRTIDKLLALLNTWTSTAKNVNNEKLVVVTPKPTKFVTASSPTATIPTTSDTSNNLTESETSTMLFTSPTFISSRFGETTETIETTNSIDTTSNTPTTLPTLITPAATQPQTQETSTTNSLTSTLAETIATSTPIPTSTLPSDSNLVLPLSNQVTTSDNLETTTDSSTITSTFTATDLNVNSEAEFLFPSTVPATINFEVSPGSVTVFSANDLSNFITSNDILSTPVTSSVTTEVASTTETSSSSNLLDTVPTTLTPQNSNLTSNSTTNVLITTSLTDSSAQNNSSIDLSVQNNNLTTMLSPNDTITTTLSPTIATDISSNLIETNEVSNKTAFNNASVTLSSRSGRLLNIVQEPISNQIDTSTETDKDYFIFAVLNNNTILRKRPSRYPNKDTPFLIVGLYPNNTLVRKFPNGTIIPMEPVIRVSGFDTRQNPPPLPEITSNQVTPEQGRQPDNKNLQTVFIVNN